MQPQLTEQQIKNKVWAHATKFLHDLCLNSINDGFNRTVRISIEVEDLSGGEPHKTEVFRERIGESNATDVNQGEEG